MSTQLDRTRKTVLGDIFYEMKTITTKEYKELSLEDKRQCEAGPGSDFTMRVPADIAPEDEDKLINLKLLAYARESRNYLSTIKNVIIFGLVITILGLLVGILRFA